MHYTSINAQHIAHNNLYPKLHLMTKIRLSKSYDIEWRLANNHKYAITKDGVMINTQTNNILKRVVVGYSVGYYIDSVFTSLKSLRKQLVKDSKVTCPF